MCFYGPLPSVFCCCGLPPRRPVSRQRFSYAFSWCCPCDRTRNETFLDRCLRSVVSMTGAAAYEVLGALLHTRATAADPAAYGFNAAYSDAGLVGVTGTCSNGNAAALTQALASCFAVGQRGAAMFLVVFGRFWLFLITFSSLRGVLLCHTVSVLVVCCCCYCYCRSPPRSLV